MTFSPNLDQLTPDQLRALAAQLLSQADMMGKKIHRDQTVIEYLTHEISILIPTAGLLAHVMVAKFADHLPLYRQEKIFAH